jgi:hypothetical protein
VELERSNISRRIARIGIIKIIPATPQIEAPRSRPRKVTKAVIDSVLPTFKVDLKYRVEGMKNELTKNFSNDTSAKKKLIEFFNSVVNENFTLLYNNGVKSNYARYGVTGPYNQTSDIQTLVNNITNKIISTLESNFIYDNALKVYINKGNINKVKKESAEVLRMAFSKLNRLIFASDRGLRNDIRDKMGRCPNGDYNLILNPDGLTQYYVLSYYETKESELFNKLNKYV